MKANRTAPGNIARLLLALAFGCSFHLQAQTLVFTHLAGSPGGVDAVDGSAKEARFNAPSGVAADAAGNLYVADTRSGTLRRIDAHGSVTTLAGLAGSLQEADGLGATARFDRPFGVAVDGSGNVYVSDSSGQTIRKVTPSGLVTTLAGQAGVSGFADGTGNAARFSYPRGLATDAQGNVYVADFYSVRKVTPGGVVTTFAGAPYGVGSAARFRLPSGIAIDGAGNVYVADLLAHTIWKITPQGAVTTLAGDPDRPPGSEDGAGSAARFQYPSGIAVDTAGTIYVADTDNGTIRKVTAAGVVTTLAGSGAYGSVDGTGRAAQFASPTGIAVQGDALIVTEASAVRCVTRDGVVSTLAGAGISAGVEDGAGRSASFSSPLGVTATPAGTLFVADAFALRRISPSGVVSTLAGGTEPGFVDGAGSAARFNILAGVVLDSAGNAYVSDLRNNAVRKVSPSGVVTTLAGDRGGASGSSDGNGGSAKFNGPTGLALDAVGNILVSDSENHTIRRITPQGTVTTLAGAPGAPGSADGSGPAARFHLPWGLGIDSSGNVLIADVENNTIRKMTADGTVTTLAGAAGVSGSADGKGSAARFFEPGGVALDGSGNVWVADTSNNTIRKVTPGGVVTTVAGFPEIPGSADGSGPAARFYWPISLAFGPSGVLYVADYGNDAIRIGTPSVVADAATIDAASGDVGLPRQLDTSPKTATSWQWSLIRKPSASSAELSSSSARNPTFTPDVPDVYVFRLVATGPIGENISTVSLQARASGSGAQAVRVVPIVLDVDTGSAHFTTELTLTNDTSSTLGLVLSYTASLGSKAGSGTVADELRPGEQRRIPDVLAYLRDRGLSIPRVSVEPSQGGTLRVAFSGNVPDAARVSALARTTTATSAPQPEGRAGLAYTAPLLAEASTTSLIVYGLRSNPTDRSNLAVINMSADPVTYRATVLPAGVTDGGIHGVQVRLETLSPWGWTQINSPDLLDQNGITSGWALVERVSAQGALYAYGVVNDRVTNDGSFLPPTPVDFAGSTLSVPVVVETAAFRSELVLSNFRVNPASFRLNYVESLSPEAGHGCSTMLTLGPGQQVILPGAIAELRAMCTGIGPAGSASYAGSLRVTVSGVDVPLSSVYVGARTAALSSDSGGGRFGLFTPPVYTGQEATDRAFVYGLLADANNRSNVAVANLGTDSDGPVFLRLLVHDADQGGALRGEALAISLQPGEWHQADGILKTFGVTNGWVEIDRTAGSAPWVAYGVINDGGNPSERTGDGAYIPMSK